MPIENNQIPEITEEQQNCIDLINELENKGEQSLTVDEKELLRLNHKQVQRLEQMFLQSEGPVAPRDLTESKEHYEQRLKELLVINTGSVGIVALGACAIAGTGMIAATAGWGGAIVAAGSVFFLSSTAGGTYSARNIVRLNKLSKRQKKIAALVKKIQEQKLEKQSEKKQDGQELGATQTPTNVLSESARLASSNSQVTNVAQSQEGNLSRSSSRSSVSL